MTTATKRRKYRFGSRAAAESAAISAEQEALSMRWLASAILQGKTHNVGRCRDGSRKLAIGWFITRNHAFVYSIVANADSVNSIDRLWAADGAELFETIKELYRFTDARPFVELIELARTESLKALTASA